MFIWQAQYMQCQWLWRAQITWNSSMVALVIYTWPQHSLHLHLVIPRSLSSKKENYRSTYSPQWSTYGSQMSTYVMKQSFHFQPVEYQTCQTSVYQLGTHTYVHKNDDDGTGELNQIRQICSAQGLAQQTVLAIWSPWLNTWWNYMCWIWAISQVFSNHSLLIHFPVPWKSHQMYPGEGTEVDCSRQYAVEAVTASDVEL